MRIEDCSWRVEEVQLKTLLTTALTVQTGDAHSCPHRTEDLVVVFFLNGTFAWKSDPGGARDTAIG